MSHYYSIEPLYGKRTYKIQTTIKKFSITLYTSSGVFSARRIDPGTFLLAETMIIKNGWRILDLGCGYGVLGILAAKLAPHGLVYMVDINKQAVRLAKLNAKLNNVKNVKILWGNLYKPVKNETFNTIISNPPQAAGLDTLKVIIRDSLKHLDKGGLLQIVAKHRKGGARLHALMKKYFGNVKVLARKAGYRVYISEKQ
ncbi:MAG: 16S rRNA methyltransferase [Thermoprotei archaeon]|nr:MAG: 16S rRNA methyltransferase [Thermoprotei archaeon]